jgi:hypothetical protein
MMPSCDDQPNAHIDDTEPMIEWQIRSKGHNPDWDEAKRL